MKPIVTRTTNAVLTEPVQWDKDNLGSCKDLPVSRHGGVVYSYWSLSWRERWQILRGLPVRIGLVGSTQPPITVEISPREDIFAPRGTEAKR